MSLHGAYCNFTFLRFVVLRSIYLSMSQRFHHWSWEILMTVLLISIKVIALILRYLHFRNFNKTWISILFFGVISFILLNMEYLPTIWLGYLFTHTVYNIYTTTVAWLFFYKSHLLQENTTFIILSRKNTCSCSILYVYCI